MPVIARSAPDVGGRRYCWASPGSKRECSIDLHHVPREAWPCIYTGRGTGVTTAQRTEIEDRGKQGASLSDMARAFAKSPASIYAIVRKYGDIPPRPRTGSTRHPTVAVREEIGRGLAADDSLRNFVKRLERAPSTIDNEIDRNGGASRYLMLLRLDGNDARTTAALIEGVQTLPEHLKRGFTWARGREMAAHTTFALATNVRVYFCDPQSPRQRGQNENANGLLRQYLPRGTDLRAYTHTDLDRIAHRLNTRPRTALHYRTPAATLVQVGVATTP